jgi:hypothetical protein
LRWCAALLALGLLATACASGDASDEAEPTDVRPTADIIAAAPDTPDTETDDAAAPTPEPSSGSDATDPDGDAEFVGVFDAVEIGDCWNNNAVGDAVPTVVPCDERHMHETFLRAEAPWEPGELYPGEDELARRLFDELCNPATIEFAGAATDELPIRTWLWYPTAADWNAGDRTILCTVATSSTDAEAPFKVGTAAAGTLTTDDAIVARGIVDGDTDLYLSRQQSILHRITSGAYRIAPAAPQVLETGLIFSGEFIVDDRELASRPWFVDYQDPTLVSSVDVGGLEGWDVSDGHLVLSATSTVFAARETDDQDWDIFISSDATGAVQLTDNPGDDRWPRVLPDETGIVYNADGRLWIMDIDGDNKRPITDDEAGPDFEPTIAPDGSQIAFTSGRSGDEDVWLVNLDGSGLRNLTNHPSTDAWPFWSPDGERLYWQTDRLGVNSHIMMMTAQGENPSYYSRELLTQGAVVSGEAAALLEAAAVPLDGRARLPGEGNFNQIEGEPGELGGFEHSSGRVAIGLPVGWEVVEIDTGRAAQFIAAERIDTFSETWAIDGVMVTLIEDNEAVWRSAIASADANRCVEDARSESPSAAPNGDELKITTIEFTCGQAAAWIVAVRNTVTETGLLLEAQFDLAPSREADEAWIIEVSQNIVWR